MQVGMEKVFCLPAGTDCTKARPNGLFHAPRGWQERR